MRKAFLSSATLFLISTSSFANTYEVLPALKYSQAAYNGVISKDCTCSIAVNVEQFKDVDCKGLGAAGSDDSIEEVLIRDDSSCATRPSVRIVSAFGGDRCIYKDQTLQINDAMPFWRVIFAYDHQSNLVTSIHSTNDGNTDEKRIQLVRPDRLKLSVLKTDASQGVGKVKTQRLECILTAAPEP